MKRVCVFCGSRPGGREDYAEAARHTGRLLAERGIGLVYGGGDVGLMGIMANQILADGGSVFGIIPNGLVAREVAHKGLTETHVVRTMHERKAKMAEMSDAFIALPGGMGTFDELCEILTWAQLGIHHKPCGILNVAGYFSPLLTMFDHAVAEGFLTPAHRSLLIEAADPQTLLTLLEEFQPRPTEEWLDAESI